MPEQIFKDLLPGMETLMSMVLLVLDLIYQGAAVSDSPVLSIQQLA